MVGNGLILDVNKYAKLRKDLPSWENYLEDCGSARIKSNEFRTDNIFNGKYRGVQVEWEGYLIGEGSITRRGAQINGMRVKMSPTDSSDEDIILQVNPSSEVKVNEILKQLTVGDKFSFKGVLSGIGNEEYPHIVTVSEAGLPTAKMGEEALKNIPLYEFKKNSRMFGKNRL